MSRPLPQGLTADVLDWGFFANYAHDDKLGAPYADTPPPVADEWRLRGTDTSVSTVAVNANSYKEHPLRENP